MYKSRLWAVIGPAEGLGPALIRYLLAREQTVIAISCDETMPLPAPNLETARLIVTPEIICCTCLHRLTTQYGKIDVLVDNYKSLPVLRFILPYMSSKKSQIIITPPGSGYEQELRSLGLQQTISTYLC